MATAFRFDDQKPRIGSTVYGFKTLNSLKKFANNQGNKGSQKFWEINGSIVSNDGSVDGIQIKVSSASEVY